MKIRLTPVNRWLEPAFAFISLLGLLYSIGFLQEYGYLPQPFFYDPTDTWMDWVNTTLWARDRGMYDTWRSIYPPLSFVFLRIFGDNNCLAQSEGGGARDCDWIGIATLHGFFLLNIFLVARTYIKVDRKTALPRAYAVAAGLPALYGLDRGNLVVVCFTFVILAWGRLLRSAQLRWLCAGLAINFKVYLIGALFPQLLKRRWRWFEGAALCVVGIYVLTFAIIGDGTPKQLLEDIEFFATDYQAINTLDLWYAGTYIPVLSLLHGPTDIPVTPLLGSDFVEYLSFFLPILLHCVQATIALAAIAAWLRPEVVPMYRLTNLGMSFALITSEAGGYTQVMILFFSMMERWQGIGRKWAILACYILALPLDIVIFRVPPIVKESFLGGRPVSMEYAFAWGQMLRPGLIMSIPFALSCVTICAVWKDIREQGWRNRRRFRFDFPFLIGPIAKAEDA